MIILRKPQPLGQDVRRQQIGRQMRRYLFCTVIGILSLLATFVSFYPAYAACEGKNIQFSDDFSRPSASWGPASNQVFRNGKYIMTVEPNGTVADWPDDALVSGDYSICAKVKLPLDPNGAAGSGLVFWIDPVKNKQGGRNLFMAMISPDKFYWVVKQVDGTKSNVIEPVQSDMVRTGPNAINEIVVLIRGVHGTLMINDKAVGDFTGEPPTQSYAGILAGAPVEKKYQVEFSDFRIVKP